ncbi:hypothetical protein HFO97_28965 [Rhizobium leguminosarum]|uniref:hypothetical protein n=1 Tax=Rhizobium leguminosarum TaxID=384 RepID=UPI001C95034A|nr:hypothetical protein [Rhizobium leguminosarum]MBY5363899.1 hypothetical protein [Rhizobium leguminosarum]
MGSRGNSGSSSVASVMHVLERAAAFPLARKRRLRRHQRVIVLAAVTAQGRFDDGFVHASYLVRQDGRTEALRPPKGPPHRRFAEFDHRP